MSTSLHNHRSRPSLRSADGFTLIELLVAMAAGLVLAGGLMTFLIVSIDQQDGVSSRTFATRQAETGLALFTRDIREAQNNADSTATLGNDTPVVITYTTGVSAAFSASFYIAPAGGCSGATTCDHLTWSCTAASGGVPGSCTRTCVAPTAALASGSCTVAGNQQSEVAGVSSATITPTGTTGNTIGTAISGTPPGSPPSFPVYVAVNLAVEAISQNDPNAKVVVRGSGTAAVTTGVNLRAWS
ncbi:MAG TPA: prepilin-type N-terminal cleavage/methylation domain-containing protein [Solirubrobacteraceae bacterium]